MNNINENNINLFEKLKIDKEKRCLRLNDIDITENDLKILLKLKKNKDKKQYNNEYNDIYDNVSNNTYDNNTYECNNIYNDEYNKIALTNKCYQFLINNRLNKNIDVPQNNAINALFMDYYHLIMAYIYFKQKKHNLKATFEIYFRKCPFEGEYAILSGTDEVIKYINYFRFTEPQLNFIKNKMKNYKDIDLFINYLSTLTGKDISIYSMQEGSIIFANEPIMIIEGNILLCQMLESAILNLLNYPILVSTNSLRYKFAINNKILLEFGCRRAQGPDGALSASKYSIFGCDSTSNVYASYLYNIPLNGTMSHSFILSFDNDDILLHDLDHFNFLEIVNKYKLIINNLYKCENRKENELKAFTAFGLINSNNFICLIDTYDSLSSGIYNFLIVALALYELNYKPIGIRIDSGDLRYIANECYSLFVDVSKKLNVPFMDLKICVSNDINEKVIKHINEEEHKIGIFAIGANLVTCSSQSSLGLIYKLVEVNNKPCFKTTNENTKANLPYKKNVYRIYTNDIASLDYIQLFNEPPPIQNNKILCINILDQTKQNYIIPNKIEKKIFLLWDHGKLLVPIKTIEEVKKYTLDQIKHFSNEHFRTSLPIPYKISFSEKYYNLYKSILCKN